MGKQEFILMIDNFEYLFHFWMHCLKLENNTWRQTYWAVICEVFDMFEKCIIMIFKNSQICYVSILLKPCFNWIRIFVINVFELGFELIRILRFCSLWLLYFSEILLISSQMKFLWGAAPCFLRRLSARLGASSGIHRVVRAVPKCRGFARRAEKFPRDLEHQQGQRRREIRRAEDALQRAEGGRRGFHPAERLRGELRTGKLRWSRRRRHDALVERLARLEEHRDGRDDAPGDQRPPVAGVHSAAGLSHGAHTDVPGAIRAHTGSVCCRRAAETVRGASEGSLRSDPQFVDSFYRSA